MSFELHWGDCIETMRAFPENSVDAIVTDPPYELTQFKRSKPPPFVEGSPFSRHRVGVNGDSQPGAQRGFMGKTWDGTGVAFDPAMWREVLRLLKPGGHLLAFGGTRTYHRMVCAIEDAGFEIRDSLHWFYGTGFPKSKNPDEGFPVGEQRGLGTALKPGHEPIVLARKPLDGTVAATIEQWGTGALNIDACRLESVDGRWPPNVLLDEDAAAELDDQTGYLKSGGAIGAHTAAAAALNDNRTVLSPHLAPRGEWTPHGDSGGASRFFYVAKPTRKERDAGCELLPLKSAGETTDREDGSDGLNSPRAGAGRTAGSVLDLTAQVKYPSAAWVNEVLSRVLPADTATSLRRGTAGSLIQCKDGSVWSMCWCGSPSTDPCRPDIKRIIGTKTSWTTESKTWSASPRLHTNGCMADAFGVMAAGGNPVGFAK